MEDFEKGINVSLLIRLDISVTYFFLLNSKNNLFSIVVDIENGLKHVFLVWLIDGMGSQEIFALSSLVMTAI